MHGNMTDRVDQGFAFLSPVSACLGHAVARPKWITFACIIAFSALGWTALGLMAAGEGGFAGAFNAICRVSFGTSNGAAAGIALVIAMWAAMVLAMMLPSAAPMILTYAEIADTAARKRETVVSPLVLAGGYTIVWLGFALAAAIAQVALARAALLDASVSAASGPAAGIIFIGAGLYQFSALKHACLTQCQRPFPFFFTNWATTPRGVFRLGVRQGLFCVGCCWAMMLLMLAVGSMNVLWMAGLGIVMTVEKIGAGRWFARMTGVAFIASGMLIILLNAAAHWPARPF
jgi:predicted metal-binding membrane protein